MSCRTDTCSTYNYRVARAQTAINCVLSGYALGGFAKGQGAGVPHWAVADYMCVPLHDLRRGRQLQALRWAVLYGGACG